MSASLLPAKTTTIFDAYWRFACERQGIFLRQVEGQSQPWTTDPVLQKYKFTNAYRAADRVSQYLIRSVIYAGDQSVDEVVFRILLFKIFNKIETWELLTRHFGNVSYRDFDVNAYDQVLAKGLAVGRRIYSAAYIMPSPSQYGHARKHSNHLRLIDAAMRDDLPARIADAPSLVAVFELLRSVQSFGDFLAYQLAIDLNYSSVLNFSEMEFIVAGPGARSGIRKCFSDYGGFSESDLIRLVTEQQDEHFTRLSLNFPGLFGRKLQLIDCQNLFCEIDKYSRVAFPGIQGVGGRTRIKQQYRMSASRFAPWFPPKWDINHRIPGGNSAHGIESNQQAMFPE